MHQCNVQGAVTVSNPVNEVALLFNSSALQHFHESDTIKYQVKFTGMAQSDGRVRVTFSKLLKVFVHVRALPSVQKSSVSLIIGDGKKYSGGDILAGSAIAVRIDARDEDGESISDKSKISPIVIWTQDGGPENSVTLTYREGHFSAQLLTHASSGSYALWASAVEVELEMGSRMYILQTSAGSVPTRDRPYKITVASVKDSANLNIILGGLIGAVAALCAGLLLYHVMQHPEQAMKATLHEYSMSIYLSIHLRIYLCIRSIYHRPT